MAQRKFETEWVKTERQTPVTTTLDGTMAVRSPARVLQRLLDEHNHAVAAPRVERWSHRRALAFIVASAATLWMAILVAGVEAAKAIA